MRKQMQNEIYAGMKKFDTIYEERIRIDKKSGIIGRFCHWKKKNKKNSGNSKNKGRKT